ncbi:MAG: hypothetical protein IJM09_00540 [Neisseriaceae bacterium]|nr:hypothetical protein [Neisseriaceae bacterium]
MKTELKNLFAEFAAGEPALEPSIEIKGVPFFVKRHTVSDMTDMLATLDALKNKNDGLHKAREMAVIIRDKAGELVFDVNNADDLALLNSLPMWVYYQVIEDDNKVNAPKKPATGTT